ncbi:hypothetical protein [Kribbella sp. CA-247076]|uniref:hypothetical protein n=1 Tax=Kribbella sp. CA-247076 TaxID=3239941 RepID=UPI003D924365
MRGILLVALAFTLTACDAAPAPTSAPTRSAVTAATVTTSAVTVLPEAKALQAALTMQDLPANWIGDASVDPNAGDAPAAGDYVPSKCRTLRHAMHDLGKPQTAVSAQFNGPGASSSEKIRSWPTGREALLQTVTEVLPSCATFTMTPVGESSPVSVTARQLSVPGLSDGVAVRFEIRSGTTWVQHRAYAVRGGTVLELAADQLSDADFVRLTGKAVAKLDAVVR